MTVSEMYQLAQRHHQAGDHGAAEGLYRQVLARQPDDAVAMNNLGTALCRRGQIEQGEELFRRALLERPDYFEALKNLGKALVETKRFEEAVEVYRRAVALRADDPQVHSNLGYALAACGQAAEALAACQRSVALRPTAAGYNNLGNALREASDFEGSAQAYRQALIINPADASAHWNLSLTLLLEGKFAQGWDEHEWRWLAPEYRAARREFDRPRWTGEPSEGGRVLVYAEQGLGDAIQFARYLPMMASRGGRPILECQPELVRLLASMPDVELVQRGARLPEFDLHCPLLSLPKAFGTVVENVPSGVPYLRAEPQRIEYFASRMPPDGRRKVGLAWAGSALHVRDRFRSLPLTALLPLTKTSGIQFFSLQKGERSSEARPPGGMDLIDWTDELTDFADTAALIANLDLVITVDTAVAHLAGAMGKPAWVLLSHVPDWRWLLGRDDSPWYPTMRLFRQPRPGDWQTPINRVAEALVAARV